MYVYYSPELDKITLFCEKKNTLEKYGVCWSLIGEEDEVIETSQYDKFQKMAKAYDYGEAFIRGCLYEYQIPCSIYGDAIYEDNTTTTVNVDQKAKKGLFKRFRAFLKGKE